MEKNNISKKYFFRKVLRIAGYVMLLLEIAVIISVVLFALALSIGIKNKNEQWEYSESQVSWTGEAVLFSEKKNSCFACEKNETYMSNHVYLQESANKESYLAMIPQKT